MKTKQMFSSSKSTYSSKGYIKVERSVDFINADFKPYHQWTSVDRKQYAARAVKRHRTKMKLEGQQAKKKYLVGHAQNSYKYQEIISLKQQVDILEKNIKSMKALWAENFFLSQNSILRKELVLLREKRLLLSEFKSILCINPRVDPHEFMWVLSRSSQDLVDFFYGFKQRRLLFVDGVKIGLEREVSQMRKQVNKEMTVVRNIPGSIHRVAIDRKKRNFLLMNVFLYSVKYENLIQRVWDIFCKQLLIENFYDNVQKIADFENKCFPNLINDWRLSKTNSKTQIFSGIEKRTGKYLLFVFFFSGNDRKSKISCQKLRLDEQRGTFVQTRTKFVTYLERTSRMNDKARINMCFLDSDPYNMISRVLSCLELTVKGKTL
eukprot:snap_masked-scaffold_42-processed-gene-1.21-mRNA-1 protein AED:1.00 eAED:1.00 QI:0/-1/0/0/-1/1/1/0/377